jgi:DNA-binding CsgD family transcriptional regulator
LRAEEVDGPLLWEREAEQAAVEAALGRAVDGHGVVLLFRGGPGLGKTSLLSLAARLAGERFTVVPSGGQELERGYPYALAQQVVEGVVRRLGDLQEVGGERERFRGLLRRSLEVGGPDGPAIRRELIFAFYWLLANAAEHRPLLLCLDDLHWSDPDSLGLLHFVVRRLASLSVALLGTLRPWPFPADRWAKSLGSEVGAVVRDLAALSPDASTALLAGGWGEAPDPATAAEAFRLTGGNPFLLEELGRVLREGGAGAAPLPASERALILARMTGVPEECRRHLEAGSVLGTAFSDDLAAQLAGGDIQEGAPELLLQMGLLRRGGEGLLEFGHPLLRRAVYEDMPEERRRQLHRRAAALLRQRGAPASVLAAHLALGSPRGDLDAVQGLGAAAAEAAALGAFDTAVVHLEGALALDPPSPLRERLLYELGRARLGAGSPGPAGEAFALARQVPGLEPRLRYLIHRSWAYSLLIGGASSAAWRQLELAMAEARTGDPSLAAEIAIGMAVIQTHGGGMASCLRLAEEARKLAAASGDPRLEAKALAVRSYASFNLGEPDAFAAAREADQWAQWGEPDEMEREWGWSPKLSFGIVAMRSGHYAEASAALSAILQRGEAIHSLFSVVWAHIFLAELEWRRGRLHEAYRHSEDVAAHLPELPWVGALLFNLHSRILLELGDLEGAAQALDRAEEGARRGDLGVMQAVSRWTRATLEARRGRFAVAADLFLQAGEGADPYAGGPGRFHWMAEAPEACARAGRPAQAAALARELSDAAHRLKRPGLEATALRCRGLLEEARGESAAAAEAFTAALALHQAADEALEQGRTLLAYGSFLRRRRLKRARSVLDEAIAVFAACGSSLWRHQAEAERLVAGGRRKAAPGSRGEELTPQEYRIAELLSLGRTNREIGRTLVISPKTLATHLDHIYQKLGVSSREALRDRFRQEA